MQDDIYGTACDRQASHWLRHTRYATSLKIHEVVGLQSPLSHELYLPYCNAAQ